MARGVLMQKGLASSVRAMWNCSPSVGSTCSLNTEGNSAMISPEVIGCACEGVDAGCVMTA